MPLQTFLLTRDPSLREISNAYCFDRKPEKKKESVKNILGKKDTANLPINRVMGSPCASSFTKKRWLALALLYRG
jgi:hypothetical protein